MLECDIIKNYSFGNSLALQWLGLRAFTREGSGLIPGRGTKIPQAAPKNKQQQQKPQNYGFVHLEDQAAAKDAIRYKLHSVNISVEAGKDKSKASGTSLVAQWLRIRLSVQGTQVQALVREGPACCGATKPTKPVRHNY